MPDPQSVRAMFGRIAGRYDLLNRVLSAGVDRRWRRAAVRHLAGGGGGTGGALRGARVVDACCGTGDLALALARQGARVVGVDFTPEMVARAGRKAGSGAVLFCVGDALRLPVPDGSADAATVAFGIRNVADRAAGLRELARVVRPGGQVSILEFSMPPGAVLGTAYRWYFTRVLPALGGLVSGDRAAYRYLPDTVLAWPSPDELRGELEAVGLVECGYRLLSRGVACLHWGRAAERSAARRTMAWSGEQP